MEWWADLLNDGSPVTLAGGFLLTFTDTGECRELRTFPCARVVSTDRRLWLDRVWPLSETRGKSLDSRRSES